MAVNEAIGIIETKGIVAVSAGIEAMCKTADVECISVTKVGMGYLTATIQGSVAAVRQAIEVGGAAAGQYGELRATRLYPRPAEEAAQLVENGTRSLLAGGRALGRGDG